MTKPKNDHPLARWRAEHGLTQDQLAADLKVWPMTVWRWEHKKQMPRRGDLEKIVKRTGLTASQILELEDSQ